mmetsp:Transcript_4802/g.11138  ORF Transcript_4802/g.11138 Transcript_4802/m.11138 type:complete len:380 (-) Transcript_4802:269-1408(-)
MAYGVVIEHSSLENLVKDCKDCQVQLAEKYHHKQRHPRSIHDRENPSHYLPAHFPALRRLEFPEVRHQLVLPARVRRHQLLGRLAGVQLTDERVHLVGHGGRARGDGGRALGYLDPLPPGAADDGRGAGGRVARRPGLGVGRRAAGHLDPLPLGAAHDGRGAGGRVARVPGLGRPHLPHGLEVADELVLAAGVGGEQLVGRLSGLDLVDERPDLAFAVGLLLRRGHARGDGRRGPHGGERRPSRRGGRVARLHDVLHAVAVAGPDARGLALVVAAAAVRRRGGRAGRLDVLDRRRRGGKHGPGRRLAPVEVALLPPLLVVPLRRPEDEDGHGHEGYDDPDDAARADAASSGVVPAVRLVGEAAHVPRGGRVRDPVAGIP